MSTKIYAAEERQSISAPSKDRAVQQAGPENLARLEGNLRRNQAATQYLLDCGLSLDTMHKYHLGMKEPYQRKSDGKTVSGVLCYPLISHTGEPLGRYGYYAIPGVTENASDEDGWGPGKPTTYYSGDVADKTILLVADSCRELWVLDQHLRETELEQSAVIISPSHNYRVPDEWKEVAFWSSWSTVYFVHSYRRPCEQMAHILIRYCGRDVFRVRVPENMGHCWADFFLAGGNAEQFIGCLKTAPVFSGSAPKNSAPSEQAGEFAVNPVNIIGAYVNSYLYYPFTIERREMEKSERSGGGKVGRLVTSYITKVVRSDGAVLDVVKLAAPRGTPLHRHVLALTDGTRIEKEPYFSHYSTWQLESIQAFIRAVQSGNQAPHPPLKELLANVVAHLRRTIWLPYEDDYTIIALYVALSFVYQVFEAIPLLIVRGEKGSGKSELGDAISRVSCNATIIGQGSPAGVVRLLNEARGLVVLDDLESIGSILEKTSFGDINQMLKLSYKKITGRKAITDKSGKTTIFDFYGPKVVNNTRGVDPILGSRMINIQTRRIPDTIRQSLTLTGSEADELMQLRNNLHVWGMANAHKVHEQYLQLAENMRDRQQEISIPLRAIANLSGDDMLINSLEQAIGRQRAIHNQMDDPIALLKEAVGNCIRQGTIRRLSAAQLRLEIGLIASQRAEQALEGALPAWLSPEWVGKTLCVAGIRNLGVKVIRVRLYGIIMRIYELREDYVRAILKQSVVTDALIPVEKKSLSFCAEIRCVSCPYDHICQVIVPGLKKAKQLGRGRGTVVARPQGSEFHA